MDNAKYAHNAICAAHSALDDCIFGIVLVHNWHYVSLKYYCILFSQKNSFEIFSFMYIVHSFTPQKDITSHLIKIDSLTFSNQIYILTGSVQFPPFLITLFLPMFLSFQKLLFCLLFSSLTHFSQKIAAAL